MVDCPQQRTAHEETLTEELFLEFVGTGSGAVPVASAVRRCNSCAV